MPVRRVVWTTHALERLAQRGLTRGLVEKAVHDFASRRRPNAGDADWRLDAGTFVVIYDQPHNGDPDAIRIVTVWRTRGRRKHHLKVLPNPPQDYPER